MNTDKLKVIQVGLSFATEEGYLPENVTTWQFNFKFDLEYYISTKKFLFILSFSKDEYANDAIELLTNSGIKFEEHAQKGVNPQQFAEYLITSGNLIWSLIL